MLKLFNKYLNKDAPEYKRRKFQKLTDKLEKVKAERRQLAKELENG